MASAVITQSTELMSNYKQAEVMAPDAEFQALQTAGGEALLFSIGTDGVFYVTQESPGQNVGWQRASLSAALPSPTPGARASTFAVAQDQGDSSIDLVLAMAGPTNDALYLSLGNSASDTSWVQKPTWTAVPFDDLAHPLNRIVIKDVFISQASDGEYIVVDVLRDPSSQVPVIFRYYIDPTKSLTGQAWNPHDVAGDIDASTVSSCLGRRAGDRVDGIYTAGSIGGHSQLSFQPLYNPFNPSIPSSPVRLALPAGVTGSALVAVSTGAGDDTTDLFVAGGQTIYYFAAGNQHDGASGVALLTDPLYADIELLFGYGDSSTVILWGLNRADQVFYTRCDRAQIQTPGAWSLPLPIFQGAEQLSPYVNRANDGNTFFVHSGINQVQRAAQAPDTTTWKFESILLPTLPDATAVKMNSYTTRIQVTDENKQPVANVQVQVSAQHRVGVYVNGLYYVLEPEPIGIPTDGAGALTIVEWVDSLQATPLTATTAGADAVSVNPMSKPFARAAALNDATSLRNATITDQDGSTRKLVASTVGDDDLKTAAAALGQLNTVYQTLPADGSVKTTTRAAAIASPDFKAGHVVSLAVAPGAPLRTESLGSFADAIEAAAGDVLSWLKHAASYVVHIVKDAAEDVWHFVVEIAGKAYRFLLDAADKVVGALEAIYRAIKTAIEDLIAFLKFLFEWKDFVRTKDVCKKLVLLSFDQVLDELETLKTDFNGLIETAKTKIDNWADIKADTWQGGVEHSGQTMGFLQTLGEAGEFLTSPGMFLFQHVTDNVSGAKGSVTSQAGTGSNVVDIALAALENEGDIVVDAINRIKSELIDGSAYQSLSLGDILKKLTAIVVDAFLNSAENLVDTLIDVIVAVARAGIDWLDEPIWIPVVSDILKDFGVTIDFSLLDVMMMVAAIPVTIGYKAIEGKAPFSEGDGFSDKVLAANTLSDLVAAFGGSHPAPRAAQARALRMAGVGPALAAADSNGGSSVGIGSLKISLDSTQTRAVYTVGHAVAGLGALVSAVLTPGWLVQKTTEDYERAQTAAGIVTGASAAIATIFESPIPIENPDMYRMSKAVSILTLVNKAGGWAIPKVIWKEPTSDQTTAAKKVTTGIDAVLAFLALTPTCYHFQELAGDPAGSRRSAAIVEETGNIVNDLNRMVTFAVLMDDDEESKAILAGVAGILMILYGGLQFAEAAISPT